MLRRLNDIPVDKLPLGCDEKGTLNGGETMVDAEISRNLLSKGNMGFTIVELEKMCDEFVKEHVKMIAWLKNNHPEVLNEYFDKHCGGLRIEFLKVKANDMIQ